MDPYELNGHCKPWLNVEKNSPKWRPLHTFFLYPIMSMEKGKEIPMEAISQHKFLTFWMRMVGNSYLYPFLPSISWPPSKPNQGVREGGSFIVKTFQAYLNKFGLGARRNETSLGCHLPEPFIELERKWVPEKSILNGQVRTDFLWKISWVILNIRSPHSNFKNARSTTII